ncbi:MAG: biosynthetic-type acetolactate synthase large subunit [Halanaerobiaceae bacterium]
MKKITGAEIFVKALYEEGVEYLFGYTGAKVITIFDHLYESDINIIMPHHEQGGVHAADGYARSTGKVGVCISTSGPGATNLVTGLATANMDSVPIVAFTGQVSNSAIGTDGFQEADIKGITLPITKNNYIVDDVKNLARIIKEAFYIARSGRPGPVLVDLPQDVLKGEIEFEYPESVSIPGYNPVYKEDRNQIEKAAELINISQKPVLYAGGGVIISGASNQIRTLAKKAEIPVTTTLTGIGSFDERNKLSLGMLGMHGTTEANLAVTNSDLLIAMGARFDDRATGKLELFAPQAKVIHIDIDPAEIGKLRTPDVSINGDVNEVLTELIPLVQKTSHQEWVNQVREWSKLDYKPAEYKKNKLCPSQIIEEIDTLTDGQALITTEVGQHQMWAAQYYKYSKPRSFLSSGGLGTMGYGLPAAVGAQIGNPDADVFCLAGDGSIQMNIQEFATIAKNKLPIKIIIFNNQYLGMVRQWQELFFGKRYAGTCLRRQKECPSQCSAPGDNCPEMIPDFVQVAKGYGIKAKRVSKPEEVKSSLKESLESKEAYLLDFIIEEEENVFPMVPAGGTLDDMILRKDVNNKKVNN